MCNKTIDVINISYYIIYLLKIMNLYPEKKKHSKNFNLIYNIHLQNILY